MELALRIGYIIGALVLFLAAFGLADKRSKPLAERAMPPSTNAVLNASIILDLLLFILLVAGAYRG